MVGLRSASQIWGKLHVYYASQTRAKIIKLKTQLKAPKRDRSIFTYLLDIKKIVDTLAAAGSSPTNKEHLEAIFYGLLEEYESFIIIVTSCLDPYTAEDIEALWMAHEERIEWYKPQDQLLPQANLASTRSSSNPMSRLMYGSIILIIVVHTPLSDTTTLMAIVLLPRILGLHLPCPIRLSPLAFSANYVRSLVIRLWSVGIGLTLIFLLILMLILLNFILQIMTLESHLCWALHLLLVTLFGTLIVVLLII